MHEINNDIVFKYKDIYDHFGDDESRDLFESRVLYSLTGDNRFAKRLAEKASGLQIINSLSEKNELYVFGAGMYGRLLVRTYPFKWRAFIDNNRKLWGACRIITESYLWKKQIRIAQ